jgi:hypothetical protein
MRMRASGTFCAVLLVVALSAIASPAWAGNGNGNGQSNGNGKPDGAPAQSQPAASPGNSGEAPGQAKKDGQDGQPAHGNSSAAPKDTQSSTGSTHGVKPSNSTAHNTNAPAGSNATKQYGNGKTAGQIAISNGYPSTGNLHGPGNSQPHKVTPCGHRHGVDVHALKSHPATGCGTPQRPPKHVPSTPEPPVVVVAPHGPSTTPSLPASSPGHDPGKRSGTAVAARAAGETLFGVLAVGHATLPFTGFPLWAAVLAAAVLVGTGLPLRRVARAKD